MFSEHRFMSCFPTGIWAMRVERAADLNPKLVDVIYRLRREEQWVPNEAVGDPGFSQHLQSFDTLHTLEEFRPFNEIALAASQKVLDFLRYEYDSLFITGCWANISKRGEGHRAHTHPNNVLSGVYYARAPGGGGDLVFEDPRPQASVLVPSNKQQTPFNSHEFRVQPTTGMLILFPSWLSHRVSVTTGDEERISIAFNVMLRGRMGFEKASTRL